MEDKKVAELVGLIASLYNEAHDKAESLVNEFALMGDFSGDRAELARIGVEFGQAIRELRAKLGIQE